MARGLGLGKNDIGFATEVVQRKAGIWAMARGLGLGKNDIGFATEVVQRKAGIGSVSGGMRQRGGSELTAVV